MIKRIVIGVVAVVASVFGISAVVAPAASASPVDTCC
jgi:hypothetical protein